MFNLIYQGFSNGGKIRNWTLEELLVIVIVVLLNMIDKWDNLKHLILIKIGYKSLHGFYFYIWYK